MSMMKFGKKTRRSPEVSLIPIINVIFLLLIFFITQGSLKGPQDDLITIPYSASSSPIGADANVVLVTPEAIYYNDQQVDEFAFEKQLKADVTKEQNLQIMLKADAGLDSTRLLAILKIVENAGVNNLYMVTTAQM